MARAIGGDILEITCNHPTKGTLTLYPKAGEDTTLDPGGFRSADSEDMIDGGGQMINQINQIRWSLECRLAMDTNTEETIHKIAALAGDPQEADWTISHVNGTIWGGKGVPVGDLKGNLNNATFPFKISGSNQLKKIA